MPATGTPVKMGKPESFGWMRCPSFDLVAAVAWERPDGVIVHAPKYDPICVVRIGNAPPYVKLMRKA